MTLSQELIDAYHATSYWVSILDKTIFFRVGQRSSEIDAVIEQLGKQEWVFMTAFNPGTQLLSAPENEKRQTLLKELLQMNGYVYFDGTGESDSKDWPKEPGLFVPGLSRKEGVAYGRVFNQFAIINGCLGCRPEYVYC